MSKIITAVAENGVIGRDNRLPWYFPEDMRWFQGVTLNATVVMGRFTWDSLPEKYRPLPHRKNIIITRRGADEVDGATFVTSINDVPEGDRVFYIGGAQIYKLALPKVDEIYLTRIPGEYDGDTKFPAWPLEDHGWTMDQEVLKMDSGLRFQIYKRD